MPHKNLRMSLTGRICRRLTGIPHSLRPLATASHLASPASSTGMALSCGSFSAILGSSASPDHQAAPLEQRPIFVIFSSTSQDSDMTTSDDDLSFIHSSFFRLLASCSSTETKVGQDQVRREQRRTSRRCSVDMPASELRLQAPLNGRVAGEM
jgi:hypothetical protein